MITSIRLKNFKNFADETLRVGPFTILVGANASGKSNIRDAFRFLSGIGRGYALPAIFGGKHEAGWKSIRGAMNKIVQFGQEAFSIEVELKLDGKEWRYSIEVGCSINGTLHVTKEELKRGLKSVYNYAFRDGADHLQILEDNQPYPKHSYKKLPFGVERPFLSVLSRRSVEPDTELDLGLPESFPFRDVEKALQEFARMRFLELSPEQMRKPAFPSATPGTTVLGDSGENLPVVLREICTDPEREKILASWLADLTPMDVTGFGFPTDHSGRVDLLLREKNGRKVFADSASDGTLRFLAMLAVLLGENPNSLYFFEEIDTGIHPARLYLLLELIEKQTIKNNIRVITTTHAPDLLTFVNDNTFENISVVCRLEDSQDAIIRPVAELPNARKLRTSQGGLGRLLASRWMETALAFTEDYDEAEDDL